MTPEELKELRRLVADYMDSEGCGCCGDEEAHKRHAEALAKMLNVKRHPDNSGYDFFSYRTDADKGLE